MRYSVVRHTTVNGMDFTIEAEVDDYWDEDNSYVKSFLITIKNETTGEEKEYCRCKSASDGIEEAIDSLKK
jgi:hypothetical protein